MAGSVSRCAAWVGAGALVATAVVALFISSWAGSAPMAGGQATAVIEPMSGRVHEAGAKPIRPLPPNGMADYQLGGPYPPATGVSVVARDWRESPAGEYAICYVNAFQTQPEQRRWWFTRYPDLLLRKKGQLVQDRNWHGEFLLDTSSARKRRALADVVGGWFSACADRGFDAVEPDNLDSWTRSRHRLDRGDAAAYSRLLVGLAHDRGLAVAQKNTAELLPAVSSIGWDFAVVEECQVYQECGRFHRAYGDAMIEIEYDDGGGLANFAKACLARGASVSIVYRDRNLVPAGAPGYLYDSC